MKRPLLLILISLAMAGCGGGSKNPDKVSEGWDRYAAGTVTEAHDLFLAAFTEDPVNADAAHGLAWTLLKLDSLDRAIVMFGTADGLYTSPSPDVLAGWALALNADKQYALSDAKADAALAIAPGWVFTYDPGLNAADLHIMKAENRFSLGDFSSSLAEVKAVNAAFNADVATPAGRSALAAEIERLRGLNKPLAV